MLKTSLLSLGMPLLAQAHTVAPSEHFSLRHTVFAGVQASRRFSARVQGGLIVPPLDHYTLKTFECFGLDRQLGEASDRSVERGSSLSIGVNMHANSS